MIPLTSSRSRLVGPRSRHEYSSSDGFRTHFGGSPLFWKASRCGNGGGGQSLRHHPNAPFQLRRDSILALQTPKRRPGSQPAPRGGESRRRPRRKVSKERVPFLQSRALTCGFRFLWSRSYLCWISRYPANRMSGIINTRNRISGSYGELN